LIRALAGAVLAVAAASAGLLIATAGAAPAHAATAAGPAHAAAPAPARMHAAPAPPGVHTVVHTVTLTARPAAQAAGRTGPRATRDPGASACDPDTCPTITCRISVDTPYQSFDNYPSEIVAQADTRCTLPVADVSMDAYLSNGNKIVDHGQTDDVQHVWWHLHDNCQAGSWFSQAFATITWPAGYVQVSGPNPITATGGPVAFTADDCNRVLVPSVVGWDQASAQQDIAFWGLTVGNVSFNYQCLADTGFVVSQNPPGGRTTPVPEGTAVNLEVSAGINANGQRCRNQQ
jgi:hypothetical protein